MRKQFLLAAAAAVGLAAAACDAPGTLTAPGQGARFDHADTLLVDITAPDSVTRAGSVTANATLIQGSGSWRYTWSFRRCNLEDQYACTPGWTVIADGQDVKSVSQYVAGTDWWVEFLVQVKDVYGHVMRADLHTVLGPRNYPQRLTVRIDGAELVTEPGDEPYTAVAEGGDGTYTYAWEQNVDGLGWEPLWDSGSTVQLCISPMNEFLNEPSSYPLDVRVTVTSGDETATAERTVQVSLPTARRYFCTGGVM